MDQKGRVQRKNSRLVGGMVGVNLTIFFGKLQKMIHAQFMSTSRETWQLFIRMLEKVANEMEKEERLSPQQEQRLSMDLLLLKEMVTLVRRILILRLIDDMIFFTELSTDYGGTSKSESPDQ